MREADGASAAVLISRLRDEFWFLPMLCAVAAVVTGVAVSSLDQALDTSITLPLLFAGGPEGARALLSAIITSMISFTGLVFSITIVVLQLTSSQFSPRVLRTFLRDRYPRLSLGVFVATFVYAVVVLRAVRGTSQVDPFVPQLAVTVSVVFVLASVAVFLGYIHHIAQSIRVAEIIRGIGHETRRSIEDRYPRPRPGDPAGKDSEGPPDDTVDALSQGRTVVARRAGVVQGLNAPVLLRLARRHSLRIEVVPAVGEFVPEGADLFRVHVLHGGITDGADPVRAGAHGDAAIARRLQSSVRTGSERSPDEDVGFGFRQLVDIAERALSPGINDPSTAVQVVDQIHDLLRRLVARPVPAVRRLTVDGRVAVTVSGPELSDYLELGVAEIAHWGADSPRLLRRVRLMLVDLHAVALPEHRAPVAATLGRYVPVAAGTTVDGLGSDIGLR